MDLHPQLGLLCGAALHGAFFPEKQVPGVLQPKMVFLATKTIFNGTRLHRRGLKSLYERFQYGTKVVARKFKN